MILVLLWLVTPTLFSVGETPNLMKLTLCMSVKVEDYQSMKDNDMIDTDGVCARQSRGKTELK